MPVDVVAAHYAAWRARDREAWLATFAPSAVLDAPGMPSLRRTEDLGAFFDGTVASFDSVDLTVHARYVTNGHVAVAWTRICAGHSGQSVTFAGIDVLELAEDGRIARLSWFFEPGDLLEQLHAEPNDVRSDRTPQG